MRKAKFLSASLSLSIASLSCMACFTGCAGTSQMPLPEDLQSHGQAMTVKKRTTLIKNRTVRLDFGPYRVEGIHKREAKPEWNGRTGHARLETESDYDFRVRSTDGSYWTCGCRNLAQQEDRFLPGGRMLEISSNAALTCNLSPADHAAAWTLELKEMGITDGNMQGRVSDGRRNISVTGTRACVNRKVCTGRHTGFAFQGKAGTLGAVEVTRKGRVVFSDETDPDLKPTLAAASAALLLYEDLNEKIKSKVRNRIRYGVPAVAVIMDSDPQIDSPMSTASASITESDAPMESLPPMASWQIAPSQSERRQEPVQ